MIRSAGGGKDALSDFANVLFGCPFSNEPVTMIEYCTQSCNKHDPEDFENDFCIPDSMEKD